jgi:hypothetical protein
MMGVWGCNVTYFAHAQPINNCGIPIYNPYKTIYKPKWSLVIPHWDEHGAGMLGATLGFINFGSTNFVIYLARTS